MGVTLRESTPSATLFSWFWELFTFHFHSGACSSTQVQMQGRKRISIQAVSVDGQKFTWNVFLIFPTQVIDKVLLRFESYWLGSFCMGHCSSLSLSLHWQSPKFLLTASLRQVESANVV